MAQRKKLQELGKRSRCYHSQIDMELLLTGSDYAQLPDSYVIFLCDFDPFYKKKYRYTFEMHCREDGTISLEDGNHTLFLSTCGENESEISEGLVKFMKYVKAGNTESAEEYEDAFVNRIREAVRNVKASREMEERYMLLEELIKDEREEAREQGRIEGKIEGKIENTQQILLKILSKTGEVPEKVREIILKEEDQDILDGYLDKALSSETCEQFLEMIEK